MPVVGFDAVAIPAQARPMGAPVLAADAVKAVARACRFTLVGLARAAPLDPAPLASWLAASYAAVVRQNPIRARSLAFSHADAAPSR